MAIGDLISAAGWSLSDFREWPELGLKSCATFRSSEAAFFAKILEFVSEFGGQMVQADKLAENIKQQKWHNASDEDVMYYFIGYEGVEGVEVYQRHTEALTTIGASFYN